MTVEYIVLGVILIVMGAVQTWLRHGPGAKDLDQAGRSGQPATGDGTGREAEGEAGAPGAVLLGAACGAAGSGSRGRLILGCREHRSGHRAGRIGSHGALRRGQDRCHDAPLRPHTLLSLSLRLL